MAMSVAHRISGVALYGGIALLAIWLVSLAAGPAAFERVQWFFGSPLGILILFGYTWILMHHMLGGVRHLVWDFGHGMEPAQRINMARFTLVGSVALTVLIWVVAFVAF
jgi:succinate dehydrogenase / fumarate reductase cytochrome b subunit